MKLWTVRGIAKRCTHLHPAPSTSTQLHPAPPSSSQLPPSSLQHPQRYKNQNIERNWVISPKLDRKIRSCPFWLKTGTHAILEVLIPNSDLDFWNSDLNIHFWENLGHKSIPCLFLVETLLLVLSIQLALVLYFKIALDSSAAYYRRFWNYEVLPIFLFYRGYIYIYIYVCIYIERELCLVPVLSKFIFSSFCSILTSLGFLGLLSIYYILKKFQNIWPFSSFLGEEQREEITPIN